jgi:hypothetical protein
MDNNMNTDQNTTHYVHDYQPPADDQTAGSQAAAPTMTQNTAGVQTTSNEEASVDSQALEDQNIFTLLGAEDGTDEQKEEFLDELQQVIWEDFIENDTNLLLTEEEMGELKKILNKEGVEELQKQEETVVYLEKLIPDLEQIMLEKALELKEDMVRERVAGLREFFSGDQAKQDKIQAAEQLMDQGKWLDAATALNAV